MSRVLRGLGRAARLAMAEGSAAEGGSACAQGGGVRGAHTEISAKYSPNPFSKSKPLDRSAAWIAKNPYIESWVYRRDKFEREFTWNKRNTGELFYGVLGITALMWGMSVFTIRHTDARNHYPARDMIFASTGTNFRLPDEREW
jgi:hypothetical protein